MNDIPVRKCTKCGGEYLATLDYFPKQKNGKYGLSSWCKGCWRVHCKEWAKNNPEKAKERERRYCQNHPDRIREKNRRIRRKNVERYRSHCRRWHSENKEKVRDSNRRWRIANREKKRANEQRRNARKRELPSTLTHEQWQHAIDYFHGCCAVCGRQCRDLFGTHTLAADHWIPLNSPDCPGTVATNMLPLCFSLQAGADGCNDSKHDLEPVYWLTRKFGKRKAAEILKRIQAYFDSLKDDT